MKKIVFLVSGNGGTLKSVYFAIQKSGWEVEVDLVVSDRDCGAIDFAKTKAIRTKVISYKSKDDQELFDLLSLERPDLIVHSHRLPVGEQNYSTKVRGLCRRAEMVVL